MRNHHSHLHKYTSAQFGILPLPLQLDILPAPQCPDIQYLPASPLLGIIALLFLIIAGLLSNLDKFAETERYGFIFYAMVLILTSLGMLLGALLPKLLKINNYQTRAISLETGLRNASLAMAIALLIQDVMGDFYSSMFFVSGIFGLWMYAAGFISIVLYKKFLPVEEKVE